MKSTTIIKHTQGFTIVEIMIALVLGLILSAGVMNVYLTTKQNYRVSESLGRMQESARFAMGLMQQNIRMAGYLPCKLTGNMANTLDTTNSLFDFFNGSMVGYEGSVPGMFTGSPFPAEGTSPGDRVAGTDAIVILRGSDDTYNVVNHQPTSANFKLNDLHTLEDGDILLVCDGNNAAIFQTTNVNSSNVTVVHNTGSSEVPGNCSKFIGGNGDCGNPAALVPYAYGPGSQLVRFIAMGFFIGVSSDGVGSSLYRLRLDVDSATITAGFVTEELVRNIENMQILYGEDTDDDNQSEQYLTADGVATWNKVLNVRVGILAETPDNVNSGLDNKVYNVAGTMIGPATTIAHDVDKKIRYPFSSTVKVRNRGLE